MSTPEAILLQRRALGWGVRCAAIHPGVGLGRDLVLRAGPDGVDLARVEGADNLAQVLELALTTRLGDDVFNTRFGFDGLEALASESSALLTRERVRIAVVKLLAKEPRVRRIIDVKLGDGRLEPVPAGDRGRLLDVRVEFETVAGARLQLALGEVLANA